MRLRKIFHKLNNITDNYVDVVLGSPALIVYSLTLKCTRIFLLTIYGDDSFEKKFTNFFIMNFPH